MKTVILSYHNSQNASNIKKERIKKFIKNNKKSIRLITLKSFNNYLADKKKISFSKYQDTKERLSLKIKINDSKNKDIESLIKIDDIVKVKNKMFCILSIKNTSFIGIDVNLKKVVNSLFLIKKVVSTPLKMITNNTSLSTLKKSLQDINSKLNKSRYLNSSTKSLQKSKSRILKEIKELMHEEDNQQLALF